MNSVAKNTILSYKEYCRSICPPPAFPQVVLISTAASKLY